MGQKWEASVGREAFYLILFIKLIYSEFGILMPMVHVIPDWVPYALNHFLFKGPFINAVRIHQYRGTRFNRIDIKRDDEPRTQPDT